MSLSDCPTESGSPWPNQTTVYLSHHCPEPFTWSSLPGAICLLSSWLECKLQESRTVSVLVIMVVPASGIQLSSVVMCLTGRWNKFKIVGSNAFILQTSVRLRRVKMTDVSLLVPGTPAMSFPPSNVFLNSQESLEKIHGNDFAFLSRKKDYFLFLNSYSTKNIWCVLQ